MLNPRLKDQHYLRTTSDFQDYSREDLLLDELEELFSEESKVAYEHQRLTMNQIEEKME
jgi:hypothetical protein